jgi:hypothetical protein
MTVPVPLDLRVARAMKAALDAEGVDFDEPTDAQDFAQEEGTDRAWRRFERENPDLMNEIRAWYLDRFPPLHRGSGDDQYFPDFIYLATWFSKHDPWWEIVKRVDP